MKFRKPISQQRPRLNNWTFRVVPGLPGLAARFDTRGEDTGVSTVSTLTSGIATGRSVFCRAGLASFSSASWVASGTVVFSVFLTAGSNFGVTIS